MAELPFTFLCQTYCVDGHRYLHISKTSASELVPETVYAETADAFSDHLQSRFEPLGHLVGLAIHTQQHSELLFSDTITSVSRKHSIDRFHC